MKNRILIAVFIVAMLCATAAQTSASLVEERKRLVTAPPCDPDDRVFLKADEAMAESNRQRLAYEGWLNSAQCYNEWVAEGRPTMPPYYEIESWSYTDEDGEVWMYFTPYPTPPPRYKPTTPQHETPAVGSLMVLSIIGMIVILCKRNRIRVRNPTNGDCDHCIYRCRVSGEVGATQMFRSGTIEKIQRGGIE